MTYTPFRLLGDDVRPPAKVANSANVAPALATLAVLAAEDRRDTSADHLAERAAIIQEGANVPREWADGFAELEARPAPRGVDPTTWLEMMDAAGRFLDQWGSKAAAHGWTAAELFGLDDASPMRRLDKRGAAFFLIRRDVVDVTAAEITLLDGKNVLKMRRRDGFTLPAWEKDS